MSTIFVSGIGVEGREDSAKAENEDCLRECVLAETEAICDPADPDDEDREFTADDWESRWYELVAASLFSFDHVSALRRLRPQSLVMSHQNE